MSTPAHVALLTEAARKLRWQETFITRLATALIDAVPGTPPFPTEQPGEESAHSLAAQLEDVARLLTPDPPGARRS